MYYAYRVKTVKGIQTVTNMDADLVPMVMNRRKTMLVSGLKKQMRRDGRMSTQGLCTVSCDESHGHANIYWDDMSGKLLDTEKSRKLVRKKWDM